MEAAVKAMPYLESREEIDAVFYASLSVKHELDDDADAGDSSCGVVGIDS
jgi:hypothetical protein